MFVLNVCLIMTELEMDLSLKTNLIYVLLLHIFFQVKIKISSTANICVFSLSSIITNNATFKF